jgi:hemerythrin superfamily protein
MATSTAAPDAITLLKADHRRVDALFDQILATTGFEIADRKGALLREITAELSRHAAVEEQFLYPTIRTALPEGRDLEREAVDEHQQIKDTLHALRRLDPTSAEFDDRVKALVETVRHHVGEEEGDLLPRLAASVGEGRLRSIGIAMRTAKHVAPTRPHRHSPNRPPGNLVVGPLAGILDRGRDLAGGVAGIAGAVIGRVRRRS